MAIFGSLRVFKYKIREAGLDMRGLFCAFLTCGVIFGLAACGGGGGSPMVINPTPTPTPTAALSISGGPSVGTGATQDFMAVTPAPNPNATPIPIAANWTVAAVSGTSSPGSIISTTDSQGTPVGRYTAPSGPIISPKMITMTATSQANSNLTANQTVFITDNAAGQNQPIKLGTSGGNSTDSVSNGTTITCCSGTLGSLIQRGGVLFILSNNHVLAKSSFGATGDQITQPGLVDNNCKPGGVVATLSEAAALKPGNGTNGPAPSNVDAAIAQIMPGTVDPTGSILDLGMASSNSIGPAPPSSTTADPATVLAANQQVAKSGRSTGLTCSNLQSITTNVSVDYDSSCGASSKAFTATFSNQVVINGGNFSAGGDSGSLVVTSDKARPVGLLYAGNSTSTTASPIQDVLNAFTNGSVAPTFISNPDSATGVSCNAVAQPHVATLAASKPPSPQEAARVTPVRNKYVDRLFTNSAVRDVGIGASADNPQEGAIVITVQGTAKVPAVLDGVRTRVVSLSSPAARATVTDLNRATAIKEAHVQGLMAQPGIQGVGVGISGDNPAEAAMVIYVVSGMTHPQVPAVIDGLRTKIVEGDRFRAFGWGKETKATACSKRLP